MLGCLASGSRNEGPTKLATSLGDDSGVVSASTVAGHAKWMKVGWADENKR